VSSCPPGSGTLAGTEDRLYGGPWCCRWGCAGAGVARRSTKDSFMNSDSPFRLTTHGQTSLNSQKSASFTN
jgi:hypothetical protein